MKAGKFNQKTAVVILLTALIAVIGALAFSFAAEDAPRRDTNSAVTDISKALTDYYYSRDISGEFSADGIFDAETASYLSETVAARQDLTKVNHTDKENYKTQVTLKEYAGADDSAVTDFQFQVISTYNYVGCDFDTTVSEIVKVQYDSSKGKITDVSFPNSLH